MAIKKNTKFIFISLLIFIVGICLFIGSHSLNAYDYWWHIKTGQYIALNKFVPTTDIFSWMGVKNSYTWISHEWLSELLFYIIAGTSAFKAYLLAEMTLIVLMLYLFISNYKIFVKNNIVAFLWFLLGGFIFFPFLTLRPHMISFILFAITIDIIIKFRQNEESKSIFLIPLISVLWANFHGGSSNLPYIICFIMIITGIFDFSIWKIKCTKLTKRQLGIYLAIAIISIFSIAINPHGFKMITYPYANMNDSFMLSFIDEWRCPDLKLLQDMPIFIELVSIFIILLMTDKKIDLNDFILIGSFSYLTLKSVRFSALLFIITSYVIFKYLNNLELNKVSSFIGKLSISIGVLGLMFFCLNITTIKRTPLKHPISDKMINCVKHGSYNRLFNDYDFGGYLIFNDVKVFVDGRADVYSKNIIKDAINVISLKDSPERIIKKYRFDALLVSVKSPLYYYLNENKQYKLVNSDTDTALFEVAN